jgi:hypothetical protein
MARNHGDTNYTPREQKFKLQLAVKDAKIQTLNQKLKVEQHRVKDLRARLKAAKD